MRFIAFALVYLFHGGVSFLSGWVRAGTTGIHTALPSLKSLLPADAGARLQANGWAGVQLFFFLSGFLIAMLLLREEERYGRIDLRAFWVRRILRIWPLYYLTLALTFFVLPGIEGAYGSHAYGEFLRKHLAAFLAFLGNWSMGFRGPVPYDSVSILWSVCVEEQFYIACPVLLAFVPTRWRLTAVVPLMGAAVGGRAVLAWRGVNPVLFQYSSLTQLDTLLAGVAMALVFVRWPPGERADRWMGGLQWPLLAFAMWVFLKPDLAHGSVARQTWDFCLLWAACAGLVAIVVVHRGWLRGLLSYSRLVWLGKISYGLYMFHEIAFWIMERASRFLGWFPNKEALETVATFGVTVALAAVSYHFFERPFLRLKKAWTRVLSRPM
jgi:peptidoglycan/LPS O-acetylase OafA/YrhL